jgi:hypothetical protein
MVYPYAIFIVNVNSMIIIYIRKCDAFLYFFNPY